MEKKKLDLVSLASIPLIMTLGNSMLMPILPQISKALHISPLEVSMLITVYAVAAIVLVPVAGYLSDQYGRKKVIIPSLVITGIGGAVSAISAWLLQDQSYWLILAGRLLQGIGAAGAAPVVMPLVGDLFPRESDVSKGLGLIETSNTFGKVLSPVLGSALGMVLWYLPFAAIPLFCIISILLVAFLVKAPKDEKKSKTRISEFLTTVKAIFKQKGRWLYAIFAIGAISMFIIFGVLFYLSSMLEDQYGVKRIKKGLILAIPLGALCLSSFITGKCIGQNKILMKWVSVIGLIIVIASNFFIAWFEHLFIIIGSLFFCGIGIGMVLPCLDAFITEGIDKEQRGTISSIYSSMRFIGVSLGPPVFSLLMRTTHMTLFLSIAGLCAAACLLTVFCITPNGKTDKQLSRKNAG